MRPSDDMPLDPFEAEELAAIEAALEGREVDPVHAELAELTVLLATDPRLPSPEFTRELDAMVARRFKGPGASRPLAWLRQPALAYGLTAVLAAVVVVLALHPGRSGTHGVTARPAPPPTFPQSAPSAGSGGFSRAASPHSAGSTGGAPGTASGGQLILRAPIPSGRRQINSAQLTLKTRGNRIDAVTQEIFAVVDREHGIVNSSRVTQGRRAGDRYATFSLGIPGSNLRATIDQLSRLRFTRVISRTDASQNVHDRYQADQRRLADARSLRATLLKELAAAKTIGQIDSLQTRIHDVESSISRREATLRSLQHRIHYSSLEVEVSQGSSAAPGHGGAGGHGLTLGRALHDAVRVLTVAAAVILIGLAAAIPVGLLAALLAWVGLRLRRRRREQALDAAA